MCRVVERSHINWSQMALVWECFEHEGLSSEVLSEARFDFNDPILLCGAGAGLLCQFFEKRGFLTTSIDQSCEMVEKARQRGFSVLRRDLANTRMPRDSFYSIVMSTGILDSRNIRQEFLQEITEEVNRLLKINGNAYFFYFFEDRSLSYVMRTLRLVGYPTNHALMAKVSQFRYLKDEFLRHSGIAGNIIEDCFHKYEDIIRDQYRLIKKVKDRLDKIGINYLKFIEENMGYELNDLDSKDEEYLQSELKGAYENISLRVLKNRVRCMVCLGGKN